MFHGNESINFLCLGDYAHAVNGTHQSVQSELRAQNDKGFRIFFIPNSGGTLKSEINKLNAFYVDFDDQTKDEALSILEGFEHWPSVIVESKKSIHAYWLLDEPYTGLDLNVVFEEVQLGLIDMLGSDPIVWTSQRQMALPGYDHTKVKAEPFRVFVREVSGEVFSLSDFSLVRQIGKPIRDSKGKKKATNRGRAIFGLDSVRSLSQSIYLSNVVLSLGIGYGYSIPCDSCDAIFSCIMTSDIECKVKSVYGCPVSLFRICGYSSLGDGSSYSLSCSGFSSSLPGFYPQLSSDQYPLRDSLSYLATQDNTGEAVTTEQESGLQGFEGYEGQGIPKGCMITSDTNTFGTHTPLCFQCPPRDQYQAVAILKRLDLSTHLNTGYGCCCPVHDDTNPSASIYQGDTGDWLLHCHSGCGTFNILQLRMREDGCSFFDALTSLMRQYDLSYDDSWLSNNQEIISRSDFKATYPNLHWSLHWHLPFLREINELICRQYKKHGYVDRYGNPCAMASYSYIANELRVNRNKLQNKLAQLSGFGLIHALPDADIDTKLREWATKTGQGRRTSVWSVPVYTDELLARAEIEAKVRYDRGETAASRSSREAQQRTYGIQAASKICPMASQKLKLDKPYHQLKAVAQTLLKQKKYYRDSEALAALGWHTEGGKNLVKTLRPSLIKELGLVGLQLNSAKKERLGITFKGYPKIWVSKSTHNQTADTKEGHML